MTYLTTFENKKIFWGRVPLRASLKKKLFISQQDGLHETSLDISFLYFKDQVLISYRSTYANNLEPRVPRKHAKVAPRNQPYTKKMPSWYLKYATLLPKGQPLGTQKLSPNWGNFMVPPFIMMNELVPEYGHHNKGFINYNFCRNWVIRNPAWTRLDSLAW